MTKFSDLKLDPKVLSAIVDAGYETPTPIQAGAIPPALEGRDVLGIAQTGTGKTASFTLPMITLLGRGRARARMPRSLVLCPTRELAAQVAENFDIYAKNTRLTKALLIGGVSFGEQDKLIDRGVDVLIATPGRLLDHFERGKLLLTGVQIMVVDEADRMLDMGFIPDIERIFQLTPFTRQTLFFSATMAPEIERITSTFLHTPERIEVARQSSTSETITQRLIELTPTRKDQTAKQKRELLRALIEAEGEELTNAIIFCNRKTDVDIVAKSLKKHGFDAAPIHGDLDQSQRMRTLDGFRDGSLRLLVASDVAARGLDIPAVSHVFNYDLPSHAEDYVHRIGRTGRAGRKGTAISIATPADEKYLTAIENLVKASLPRAEKPEGFSLSDAAQNAPRSSSRGGGNGRADRGRGGRGRNRRDDSPRDDSQHNTAAEPRSEDRRSDDRRSDDRRTENRRDDNTRSDRNDTARDRHDRGDDRRQDRRDDRRNGRGRDRNDVLGMGDHIPEFMTRSFLPEDLSVATPAETGAEAETAPATQPEEAPKKRSRSRKRKADPTPEATPEAQSTTATDTPDTQPEAPADASATNTPAEAAKSDAAETPPAANPEAEATPESAAPAPKKAPRKRAATTAKRTTRSRKKTDEAAATEGATAESATTEDTVTEGAGIPSAEPDAATEAPKKPVRKRASRAKKPTPEDNKSGDVAATGSAKDAAGDTPEDAPKPKPRRTRKTKPKTDADPATPEAGNAQSGDAASE